MNETNAGSEIRVLVYEPGAEPRVEHLAQPIDAAIGKVVAGFFEAFAIDDTIAIMYNEMGRSGNLPRNRLGMYGTFVVVAREAPEIYRTLSDAEEARARAWIRKYATTDIRH